MAKLASKIYGDALFELAVEEGRVDSLWEEVRAVRKAMSENRASDRKSTRLNSSHCD